MKKFVRPAVLSSFLDFLFPLILNSKLSSIVYNAKSIHGLMFLCVEILYCKTVICKGAKWEAIFNVVGAYIRSATAVDSADSLRVGLQGVEMLCGNRGYSCHASNGTLERVVALCVGCLTETGDKTGRWRDAEVAREGRGGNRGGSENIMRGVGVASQHLGAFAVANDVLVLKVFTDDPSGYADGTSRIGRGSTMSGGGGGAPEPDFLGGVADIRFENDARKRVDSRYEDTDDFVPPHTMHRKLWGGLIACLEESSTRNVRVREGGDYLWGLDVEIECLKGLVWLAMVPGLGKAKAKAKAKAASACGERSDLQEDYNANPISHRFAHLRVGWF